MTISSRAAPVLAIISALFSAPAVAADQVYERHPTWQAGGWTVDDDGGERCDATFAIDDVAVLSVMGPYYDLPGGPPSGRFLHLDDSKQYKLPRGDKYGDFPAELAAGDVRFDVTGSALDFSRRLMVDPGDTLSTLDLLSALPDAAPLIASVRGKQIFTIPLTGTHAAAKALADCTAFITAQKRPGTKDGPRDKNGGRNPPPPIMPARIEPPSEPAVPTGPSEPADTDVIGPNPVPRQPSQGVR